MVRFASIALGRSRRRVRRGVSNRAKTTAYYRSAAGPISATMASTTARNTGLLPLIKSVINNKIETKYNMSFGALAANVPLTAVANNPYFSMPPILLGTGSFQRIGEKINSINGYTQITFYFNPAVTQTEDVLVKIFYGQNKSVKAQNQWAGLSNATMLDLGNGTSLDWDPAAYAPTLLNQFTIQKEVWSLKTKVIRFTKNNGLTVGDVALGQTPNLAKGYHTVRLPFKHKSAGLYPTVGVVQINNLTNFCPVWWAVAYYADTNSVAPSPAINMTSTNHVHYKDS